MNRPALDDIDLETAGRIKAHLDALVAGRAQGVTEAEATRDYCHCNNAGCDRCERQATRGADIVAKRHAEMYPAIAEAQDAARYHANPAAAIRSLDEKMTAQMAELAAALVELRRAVVRPEAAPAVVATKTDEVTKP